MKEQRRNSKVKQEQFKSHLTQGKCSTSVIHRKLSIVGRYLCNKDTKEDGGSLLEPTQEPSFHIWSTHIEIVGLKKRYSIEKIGRFGQGESEITKKIWHRLKRN